MSNAQEPSYYEIALTNRQVVGFFVVLLICVVGAFFSGVWLGQKRGADLPMLAEATVSTAVEQPQGELEELNFFTDAETPPQRVDPAPEPRRQLSSLPVQTAGRPDTTLLEDVGGGDTALLEDVSGNDTAAPEVERPSASEAVAEPPATPTPAPVAPLVEGLVVQVFASPNGAQAEKLLADLREAGYQAFLSTTRVDDQTMHRVRIGPFQSRSQAEAVKRRVDRAYKVSSFITTNE